MTEVKWIKITTDMFDNRKIKLIRKMPGGTDIILFWVMLLTLAGKSNSQGYILLTEALPYTAEMLANEFDIELNTVKLALDIFGKFNMISVQEDAIVIKGWAKYQNAEGLKELKEREQARLRKRNERDRKKMLPEPQKNEMSRKCHGDKTVTVTVNPLLSNSISLSKDNINTKDINNNCSNNKEYISLKFIDEVIDKVNLTLEQYNKLINKFGSALVDKTILALDNYIANGKGNKYKDHFRVLNTWCSKDASIKSTGKKSNVEKGLELIKKYENEEPEGGGKSVWDV